MLPQGAEFEYFWPRRPDIQPTGMKKTLKDGTVVACQDYADINSLSHRLPRVMSQAVGYRLEENGSCVEKYKIARAAQSRKVVILIFHTAPCSTVPDFSLLVIMQINAYLVSLAFLAIASAAGVPSKVERTAPHPVIAARDYCCSPSPQNPNVCVSHVLKSRPFGD